MRRSRDRATSQAIGHEGSEVYPYDGIGIYSHAFLRQSGVYVLDRDRLEPRCYCIVEPPGRYLYDSIAVSVLIVEDDDDGRAFRVGEIDEVGAGESPPSRQRRIGTSEICRSPLESSFSEGIERVLRG